jgi:hypothetical protein
VYTAKTTALAKLRAYHQELVAVYLLALRCHDYVRARDVFNLRRRVRRAILIREEWDES